jgi:hypothetical protein
MLRGSSASGPVERHVYGYGIHVAKDEIVGVIGAEVLYGYGLPSEILAHRVGLGLAWAQRSQERLDHSVMRQFNDQGFAHAAGIYAQLECDRITG